MSFSSMTGAIMRHGPHQGAQKSTITGLSLSSTRPWNVLLSISMTSALSSPRQSADARAPAWSAAPASWASSHLSASIAAMQPLPAAVTAWR